MLQTSNLVRKYKYICCFSKNISFSTKTPLILLMSAFFRQKISIFCKKQYFYSKHQYESCVRDSILLFPVFVRQKVTDDENVSCTEYKYGPLLSNCSRLTINPKNDNEVTNSAITPSSDFFGIAVIFFSSLVTGPSFTSISLLVLEL